MIIFANYCYYFLNIRDIDAKRRYVVIVNITRKNCSATPQHQCSGTTMILR